jgi:hypothetical protein
MIMIDTLRVESESVNKTKLTKELELDTRRPG